MRVTVAIPVAMNVPVATIDRGDSVVLSSRIIPGNEKAIYRMMNHFAKRGADVIYGSMNPPLHVSGHGSAEELKLILNLVRPKYFMPIHGEYRQLAKHATLAELSGYPGVWQIILEVKTQIDRYRLLTLPLEGRMTEVLAEHRAVSAYREAIADPGTRIALAEAEGALAGYALIHWPSEFASESDASRPLALHQLYCAAAMTGRGIGAALMEWALAEARALGCDAVQLSVWSENFAAQRFYARYGFSKIADIGFMVGNQRDEEFLLELRLRP